MIAAAEKPAEEIKLCAPLAVAASTAVLKTRLDLPAPRAGKSTLVHIHELNADVLDRNASSEDRFEGPLAFAEKRAPIGRTSSAVRPRSRGGNQDRPRLERPERCAPEAVDALRCCGICSTGP